MLKITNLSVNGLNLSEYSSSTYGISGFVSKHILDAYFNYVLFVKGSISFTSINSSEIDGGVAFGITTRANIGNANNIPLISAYSTNFSSGKGGSSGEITAGVGSGITSDYTFYIGIRPTGGLGNCSIYGISIDIDVYYYI